MTAATRTGIRVISAVPTFPVPDVAMAIRWYVQELGFTVGGTFPKSEPYAYASIHLGPAEIMFLSLPGYVKPDLAPRRPEGIWDAYIRVDGVRELYGRVEGKPFIRMSLRKQRYGDWEFEVRDPHGYIIVFGGDGDA
jgi:catechol 2,3-dioxygenase-like lactoylglutathione lyase family enzyme